MLLDFLFPLELLPGLPQFFKLPLLTFAFGVSLILSFLGHFKLISKTVFHFFCCFPLGADGIVFLLELGHLSPQFLTGGLGAIMKDLSLGDLGCKLVEDFFVLH